MNKVDYSLYLVTDRELMSTATLEEAVLLAIRGGCTVVQLREKDLPAQEFYNQAVKIKKITDTYQIPLIINDRVDIGLAVDAAGVHIGQSDLPAHVVRRLIGPDKLLGVSVSSLAQAQEAAMAGAGYLGVGAMFATGTKTDAVIVAMDELKAIRQAVSLPLVVIGGINQRTIPLFAGTGIDGLAIVSAVIGAPDITAAARESKALFEGIKNN